MYTYLIYDIINKNEIIINNNFSKKKYINKNSLIMYHSLITSVFDEKAFPLIEVAVEGITT